MRKKVTVMVGLVVLMLAGCGAPREALVLASREKVLATMSATGDQQVREALAAQVDAWQSLSQLVQRREFGGIAVDASFVEMVREVSLLANRQRELIERGEDDPAMNRQSLERFGALWSAAEKYLGK